MDTTPLKTRELRSALAVEAVGLDYADCSCGGTGTCLADIDHSERCALKGSTDGQ